MKNSLVEKVKSFFRQEFESLKFATATLLDGTIVSNNEETDEFEVNQYLYTQKDSTLSPAPAGKHETTEVFVLEVDEAGQIVAIYEKEDEREGESEADKARRKSFKARHAKNIAKGKLSAAYWSNREKW